MIYDAPTPRYDRRDATFMEAFADARKLGYVQFRWDDMVYNTKRYDETTEQWEAAMAVNRGEEAPNQEGEIMPESETELAKANLIASSNQRVTIRYNGKKSIAAIKAIRKALCLPLIEAKTLAAEGDWFTVSQWQKDFIVALYVNSVGKDAVGPGTNPYGHFEVMNVGAVDYSRDYPATSTLPE